MFLRVADWLKGSGRHSVSVPVMDGALKPNDDLDSARKVHSCPVPDNLTVCNGVIHFSTGRRVMRLDPQSGHATTVDEFEADVTCLAATGDQLAVGLESGELRIRGGRFAGSVFQRVADRAIRTPSALHFEDDKTLLLALGSQINSCADWKRDLMQGRSSGSVWRIDLASAKSRLLCDRLAFPYGLAVTGGEAILVAESWSHRIVDISVSPIRAVVDDLPFYPARLASTSTGDVLVCGFAPRRQLVEFVLREREFLRRMISEIPERHWMAPALSSGADVSEPLQQGQIRQHGVVNRWAPTKSYGLIARMDTSGRFLSSSHSRAGGQRHGITSAVEWKSEIVLTSKGGGAVLRLPSGGA